MRRSFFISLLYLSVFFTNASRFDINDLIRPDGTILKAFFTPFDNVREVLVKLINNEKNSIKIASYFLTDHVVAKALKNARERAVEVTIIVDYSLFSGGRHATVLYELAKETDLNIFRQMNRGLMHNKFIVFEKNINDEPLAWTGSYNLTHSAQNFNFENVLISNDYEIIEQYQKTFDKLLAQSVPAYEIFAPVSLFEPFNLYKHLYLSHKPIINMLGTCLD